ncbi:hypothetical protein MOP89_14335 [Enterococcus gallinarum]|nr:hypothetical protein [Enterococcus gallinarum]
MDTYPNCEQLIGQVALLLDVQLLEQAVPAKETYQKHIHRWYERALESRDEDTRNRAADSLFGFYVRKEAYEKAESYLHYFSNQNPEKKANKPIFTERPDEWQKPIKLMRSCCFLVIKG